MKVSVIIMISGVLGIIIGAIGVVIIEEVFDDEDDEGDPLFTDQSYHPLVDPEDFVVGIDHSYMTFTVGTMLIYEGETDEGMEHIEVVVLNETRMVMGIECMVVRDTVTIDGEVAEDTYDWFAQDIHGNIWYFGEDSREMESGEVVSTEGSWEAGVDGALPGVLMPGIPLSGFTYRQEFYKGEAEDMASVVRIGETVNVEYGSFQNCLKTFEWNPLEGDSGEYKFYAPGVGMIMEGPVDGDERIELIDIKSE
jgi:hypothetical protein